MKKLSNVSPFLLLLFPVLIMMVFAFATADVNQHDEIALKTNTPVTTNIVKATTDILK